MKSNSFTIDRLGCNGEGVGHLEGYIVFVDGALPGETILFHLSEKHKRYGRGELISITNTSPDRVAPTCPLFGACGGCQLMHLSYDKQLEMKRQKVEDALIRIGKLKEIEVKACFPSPNPLHYRNKIQIPIKIEGQKARLGLYARSSHELVEMEQCFIHSSLGQTVYEKVSQLIKDSSPAGLRHLLIKSTLHTQEALVIVVSNGPPTPALKQLAERLLSLCPEVKGVVHNENAAPGNVILGKRYTTLAGASSIEEILCGLKFKVSPASFFQVNPLQAEKLYEKVVELAALTGKETVLDAFCGVGTLSLILAQQAKHVLGVECVPEAIADAQENSKHNHISNITFHCDFAEKMIHTLEGIDVLVINPPRKGCDPSFLSGVKQLLPKQVIYISCDPATLARDLAILVPFGYIIESVQPFDMFPQTAHVETCVSLRYTS